MNRLVRNIANKVMGAFVGAGVSLGDDGALELPDGLCPDRVHRFIEAVTAERFDSPRAAMHALFSQIGVSASAVGLLDRIIDEHGDVDFARATRQGPKMLAAIPEFQRIPGLFRDFLVEDLALASSDCTTLAEAVTSARVNAAAQLGCTADWDVLLEQGAVLGEFARPWRERHAAA